MPLYDAALYDPPAPVADVILRNPMTGSSLSEVHLLIDTGADVTLVPVFAADAIGIQPVAGLRYDLVGFDGVRTTAEAAELDLVFLHKQFRGRYLLTSSRHGILGRDVLNSVSVAFDGPGQTWAEFKRQPNQPKK
jgi:hypothetical protein